MPTRTNLEVITEAFRADWPGAAADLEMVALEALDQAVAGAGNATEVFAHEELFELTITSQAVVDQVRDYLQRAIEDES